MRFPRGAQQDYLVDFAAVVLHPVPAWTHALSKVSGPASIRQLELVAASPTVQKQDLFSSLALKLEPERQLDVVCVLFGHLRE